MCVCARVSTAWSRWSCGVATAVPPWGANFSAWPFDNGFVPGPPYKPTRDSQREACRGQLGMRSRSYTRHLVRRACRPCPSQPVRTAGCSHARARARERSENRRPQSLTAVRAMALRDLAYAISGSQCARCRLCPCCRSRSAPRTSARRVAATSWGPAGPARTHRRLSGASNGVRAQGPPQTRQPGLAEDGPRQRQEQPEGTPPHRQSRSVCDGGMLAPRVCRRRMVRHVCVFPIPASGAMLRGSG